jgi:endoglucanase
MDDGPSITLSVVTDRSLTASIIDCAERNELKLQKVVEATNTGTDATALYVVREGIPVAVVSIPLKNMHTYSEVISVNDVEDTAKLLKTYIEDKEGFVKWINA